MTINEYQEKYVFLTNAQVRNLAKESPEFREETEMLYRSAYNSVLNKSCSDCWVDAYAVLMRVKPSDFAALSGRSFDLRAGALLLDVVNGDNTKMCTRVNLTDELALYHLKTNPNCVDLFCRLPDNWKELVANYSVDKKTKNPSTKGKRKK